jgi:hypothetical protein
MVDFLRVWYIVLIYCILYQRDAIILKTLSNSSFLIIYNKQVENL